MPDTSVHHLYFLHDRSALLKEPKTFSSDELHYAFYLYRFDGIHLCWLNSLAYSSIRDNIDWSPRGGSSVSVRSSIADKGESRSFEGDSDRSGRRFVPPVDTLHHDGFLRIRSQRHVDPLLHTGRSYRECVDLLRPVYYHACRQICDG